MIGSVASEVSGVEPLAEKIMYILMYTLGMEMNVTEIRRRILTLLKDLPEEGILITRRGQPLARLVPAQRPREGRYVTAPLIEGKGEPGPLCPTAENAYDLLFD